MNLLRPSITTILQHWTDGWDWQLVPWFLICSSNQNNVRWIATFFIFSLDLALLTKTSLGVRKGWLKRWLHLGRDNLTNNIARHQLRDIFNAHEFGLFYQALPSKSLHFRGKRCSSEKHTKVRLTKMAGSNALDEKISMFVIGKSASLRCFKHVHNLPCRYWSQKKI